MRAKETKTVIFLLLATLAFSALAFLGTDRRTEAPDSYQIITQYEGKQAWDEAAAQNGEQALSEKTASPVCLNTADIQELETLPHIGPVLAQRIVEWRESNGPYQSVDDLLQIRGIGAKTVDNIRNFVTVEESE